MFKVIQIIGDCPQGYEIKYRINDVIMNMESERKFIKKCFTALASCLKNVGLNEKMINNSLSSDKESIKDSTEPA
jgi:hypothetical protein